MMKNAFLKPVLTLLVTLLTVSAWAGVGKRHLVPVAPDSSDFVRASVIYVSPLNNFESIAGHCALHMECPSEGFDVIFTISEEFGGRDWGQLIARTKVKTTGLPADTVINVFRAEGRQVVEWPLNLSHHEKQRLWMLLDQDAAKGSADKHFCYINGQCTSMVLQVLERCTIGEYIDLGPRLEPMTLTPQGNYLRWVFRDSPWFLFGIVTFGGDSFDRSDPVDHIICPELIIPLLQQARLRSPDDADSVTVRPLLMGTHQELLPLVTQTYTTPVTPRMVFTALLVLTVFVTLLEWLLRQQRVALWFDRVLFVLYALWAVAVVWLVAVGVTLGDACWNWYIIPFNPLPIVIWARQRKRPQYKRVFLLYAVVLTLFLLATPLSAQIDLDHQLITASLAIRCFSNYYQFKYSKTKPKI